MNEFRKDLTLCAFCPNTCRPTYAAEASVQIESQTPSALSLIVLAVLDGRLPLDAETQQALGRRGPVEASVGHCTYGLNMPAVIDAALQAEGYHG